MFKCQSLNDEKYQEASRKLAGKYAIQMSENNCVHAYFVKCANLFVIMSQ